MSFGVNVLNNRSKTHAMSDYGNINSFSAYESMYAADGSGNLNRMEADVYPGEDAFSNSLYSLKDPTYNFAEEMGWTAQAQFQYEDINSRSQTRYNNESHYMRSLYNLYTTAQSVTEWVEDPNFDWDAAFNDPNTDWFDPYLGMMQVTNTEVNHAVPDGDLLSTYNTSSQFYTFRAQTQYNREFGAHAIDVLAGFEYRQTHTTTDNDLKYGYDHQTQTNLNTATTRTTSRPTTCTTDATACSAHTAWTRPTCSAPTRSSADARSGRWVPVGMPTTRRS